MGEIWGSARPRAAEADKAYRRAAAYAEQAEGQRSDVVWAVEHHFYDYSFCPDNTVWLASIVSQTERVDVGTAAVIMPWNEPLRVAEKIALLDHIAAGRLRFGMGRGLSRREYSHFRGIEMDESRERFDESAAMVSAALETGYIEGDGPYSPQPRTAIRPAPERSFEGRTYAVATSDDSIEAADYLLHLPGALLVVDGYNVSMTAWPEVSVADQRRRLVAALGDLAARTSMPVEVVFDGADVGPAVVPGTARALVRTRFSPPGVEADDVVLDLVAQLPPARPVVVVSSDHRVREGARRLGANTLQSAQLVAVLARR